MLRCSLIFLSGFTSREYLIASVDFIVALRGQIRKLRFALVVCIVFSNGEYHIVCVDFICSSRGRLKRDRGFANPLSLSNTSPDPWGYPLRRGISAAAGLQEYRNPVSGAGRSSPLRYIVWVLCVRAETVRVSENHVGLRSHVFHWWWDGLFVPAATVCFAMVYRWDYR